MVRLFLVLFSFVALMFAPVSVKAEEFTEAQKTELQKMFKDYIMNNGEVIIESVSKYQQVKEAESMKEMDAKARDYIASFEGKDNLPMAGNKDGDVTIVEFFDYNCGYCRKALQEIKTVLDKDKNVKVVFIDMPILGQLSREISKWSVAANMQGNYFEFHRAVMDTTSQKDNQTLINIAKELGLDVKRLRKDKESKEVAETIDENLAASRDMGIRGTPGFIIGEQVVRGYIPADQILALVKEERQKKSKKK